jgi:hypothetical protein
VAADHGGSSGRQRGDCRWRASRRAAPVIIAGFGRAARSCPDAVRQRRGADRADHDAEAIEALQFGWRGTTATHPARPMRPPRGRAASSPDDIEQSVMRPHDPENFPARPSSPAPATSGTARLLQKSQRSADRGRPRLGADDRAQRPEQLGWQPLPGEEPCAALSSPQRPSSRNGAAPQGRGPPVTVAKQGRQQLGSCSSSARSSASRRLEATDRPGAETP